MTLKSKGHIEFLGKWEYFLFNNELYRAPKTNPLDNNSIRMGGRQQAPSHLVDSTLEFHREAFK